MTRSTAPAQDLSLDEAGALAPLVSPGEAAERVAAGAVLVDVRSDAGRATTGSLPGATVVDRYAVDTAFDLDSAARVVPALSLDTPVVVVCGSVRGSGPVAAALRDKGFTDVVHVEGGAPAWRDAGLPVEQADDGAATSIR
ncbi:rhodanese-like domain-containing protein [Cellulomonas fimi]|uniref:Rhodanese domain protein n=1 Tax=Cellulomonas fimi (strain ATCC 484 / DSM 20113 / JCM 1341 / CCUG 24087 / LMG 16345 / NBRC 15513 / NCIMB 8980 / NCTC 7547 / NRS-133) TaxID=590998 RepID=F4H3J7_CELFA|nr:rhodanese-like domain-containing protein [Cellulomonas fimi]AEE46542.1 Rhodanese domain protein [Cellulomonas fimi ATCC 484]NNH09159.1 sulfurtransferase [Cellulomonas fimi]VEH33415.1 molybdopterin biosynthesis protein MoeB [Cellulomonas fimi]